MIAGMKVEPPQRNAGEDLFEQYMAANGLPFRYQPHDLGEDKRPDYLVATPRGDVLAEVTDFFSGRMDKPVVEQLAAKRRPIEGRPGASVSIATGVMDVEGLQRRIRDKIVAEAGQLAPFRGRYPGVIVLHNFALNDGPERMTIVTMGLDEPGMLDVLSGLLTQDMNTAISAVAVLKIAQPHEDLYGRAVRDLQESRGQQRERWHPPTTEEIREGFELWDRVNSESGGKLSEKHPVLEIYYNPYAAKPLPLEAFPGPYDLHNRLIPRGDDDFTLEKFG